MAIPGEMHLFDLKSVIYDTPYKNEVMDTHLDGFELIVDEPLTYKFMLDDPEKIRNLFMMTPYAYRTGKKERERLMNVEKLTTRVEFLIDIYEKSAE